MTELDYIAGVEFYIQEYKDYEYGIKVIIDFPEDTEEEEIQKCFMIINQFMKSSPNEELQEDWNNFITKIDIELPNFIELNDKYLVL